MSWQDLLRDFGVNPEVFIAGGAGGVLRALYRKKISLVERILSPLSGALAAAYLTIPVVHYAVKLGFPTPDDPQPAVLATGFLVGTSAMWISDIVFAVITRRLGLREIENK